PFLAQTRRRQVTHAQWMRARVAADLVAAPPQIADAGGIEESARADVVDGYEKAAAKAVAFERACGPLRARAAIVKRHDGLVRARSPGDRREMRLELRRRDLVARGIASGEARRVVHAVGDDVVIHQRGHASTISGARRWRARTWAVSHGCPQVADRRPLVSIGVAVPASISSSLSRI